MCNINITLYLSCMCPCRTALAVVTGCGCTFRAYNFSVVFTVMSGICGYIHKCVFNILYLFLLYLFRENIFSRGENGYYACCLGRGVA